MKSSKVTHNSVTLSFDYDGEKSVNVYESGTMVAENVTSPHLMKGLDESTTYTFTVGTELGNESNPVTITTLNTLVANTLHAHRQTSHSVILDWNRDVRDGGDGKFEITYTDGTRKTITSDDNALLVDGLKPDTEYEFTVKYVNSTKSIKDKAKTVAEIISDKPVESISFVYDKLNVSIGARNNLRLEAFPLGTSEGKCRYTLDSYDAETKPKLDEGMGRISMYGEGDTAVVRATNIANPELTATINVTAVSTRVPMEDITFSDGTKLLKLDVEVGSQYPIRTIHTPSDATGVYVRFLVDGGDRDIYTSSLVNGFPVLTFVKSGEMSLSINAYDDSSTSKQGVCRIEFNVISQKEPLPEGDE